MNTSRPFGRDIVSLCANAAALHILYVIINRNLVDPADRSGLLLWCALLAGGYLLAVLLSYLLKNAKIAPAVALATMFVQLMFSAKSENSPHSIIGWGMLLLLWAVTRIRLCEYVNEEPSNDKRIFDFETTALAMVLAFVMASLKVVPGEAAAACGIFALLTLLSLARQRMTWQTQSNRSLQSVAVVVIPVALLLILAVILSFVSAPFASVLQSIILGIKGAALAAGRFVLMVFEKIMSLFPEPEIEQSVAQQLESVSVPSTATSGEEPTEAVGAMLMGTLVFLIGGVFLGVFITAKKTASYGKRSKNARYSRSVRLIDAVKKAIEGLRNAAAFRMAYALNKNNVSGIFCWLEKTMKSRRKGRRPGETPADFVRRCKTVFAGKDAELDRLADIVDEYYFGHGASELRTEALAIKRKISGGS